ncbi:alpha-2,8-polysialyltransferase family protein [Actinocorallia lasiicapitis]
MTSTTHRPTTQICLASTPFGAMTLAAALDAGLLGAPTGRRILLLSNNAAMPELAPGLDEAPGWETIAHRFDETISWNAEIAPLHPSGWLPREEELPLYERWLRDRWNLGDGPVELVVESVAVSPARTLCAIFFDAPITVYSDGLMSYGPTRSGLPSGVGSRIDRLLHLDLVPGLRPQLLREYGVDASIIPDEAFRAVLDKLTAVLQPVVGRDDLTGAALIVGQYLSALEILTAQEEDDLHVAMLRGVVARGHTTVLFKPHPASPVRATESLAAEAARLGARLAVVDDPVPAETWCAAVRPELIVGCFSTALVTAAHYYGIPAAAVGTGPLLDRLAPYENSNRVPVTIIDAMLPRLGQDGKLTDPLFHDVRAELEPLLDTVAYAMQAGTRPDLRSGAARFLTAQAGGPLMRYFKKRRLTSLNLPGGLPQSQKRLVAAALPPSSRRRRLALRAIEPFRTAD